MMVVDDGSEDETSEICLSLSNSNVHYFRQKNQGEAAAVNQGIRKIIDFASSVGHLESSNKSSAHSVSIFPGQFVCILSHDDTLVEGSLLRLKNALSENRHAAVAYGNVDIVDETGRVKFSSIRPEYDEKDLIGRLHCLPSVGTLIRLDAILALERYGYQLRNPGIRFISDLEQWVRLSAIGPFLKVNQKVGDWMDHDSQASKIVDYEDTYKDIKFFLDLFKDNLALKCDSNTLKLAKSNLHRRAAIVHSSYGAKIGNRPFY